MMDTQKRHIAKCIVFGWTVSLLSIVPILSQAQWKKVKSANGITVYTKRVSSSNYHAFKAVTKLKTTVDTLLAIFDEPAAATNWVHQCKTHKLLKYISFAQRYTYQVYDLPWPAQDRDVVLHHRVHKLKGAGNYRITMTGKRDFIPPQADRVRIPKVTSIYELRTISNGYVAITWKQYSETGGNIPTWVSNSHSIDMPYNSLQALGQMVQKARYKNVSLAYTNGTPSGFKSR